MGSRAGMMTTEEKGQPQSEEGRERERVSERTKKERKGKLERKSK
jgi:hypothetical protein